MDRHDIVRIDGVKWWVTKATSGDRLIVPLCPDHDLRMTPYPEGTIYDRGRKRIRFWNEALKLECAEGPHYFQIPRVYEKEQKYVGNRIDAKVFKGMKVLNLDDEATPVSKSKAKTNDEKFYVKTQIMESKRGKQVVIYAGEKGKTEKSQIFISPSEKRLSFDQKDLHPNDVFLKVEATFDDGSKQTFTM